MWAEKHAGVDFNVKAEKQFDMDILPPNFNHQFMQEVEKEKFFSRRSFDKYERMMHSHGEALNETFSLRHGTFERFADIVLYPGSHE